MKELVELGEKLNPAALTAVASFVAYLIGSLSEDLVGLVVREPLQSVAAIAADREYRLVKQLTDIFKHAIRESGVSDADKQLLPFEGNESFREAQIARLENEASRLESESDLRLAILPPLVALIVYLSINDGLLWLFGLLLAAGVGVQTWARTRDYLVAEDSLVRLRRQVGVPPASVAEVRSAAQAPTAKLQLIEFARKGREILESANVPTDLSKEWVVAVGEFLLKHARPVDAERFLEVPEAGTQSGLRRQIEVIQNIALRYDT